jgi:hypothetical protein
MVALSHAAMVSANNGTSDALALSKGRAARNVNRTDMFIRLRGKDAIKAAMRSKDTFRVVTETETIRASFHSANVNARREVTALTFVNMDTRSRFTRAAAGLTVDIPNKSYRVQA